MQLGRTYLLLVILDMESNNLKQILTSIVFGLLTACASNPSMKTSQETPEMNKKDKALSCLVRWDMSLYAYTMRVAGGSKPQAREKLKNWYGASDFISKEIAPASDFVYNLTNIKSDPIFALGDSLKSGFKSCLVEKNITQDENYLSNCLDMGIYITYVASAKSRGWTKQQVLDQLTPKISLQRSIIDKAFSDPKYNAGNERIAFWGECLKKFE